MTDEEVAALAADPSKITEEQLAALPSRMTAAEWADLSAAEREAMLTDIDDAGQHMTEDELEAAKAVGDDEEDPDDAQKAVQGVGETKDDKPADQQDDKPKAPAADQDPADRDFVYRPRAPQVDLQALTTERDTITARTRAIEDELTAAEKAYDEGDLSSGELAKKQNALWREMRGLDARTHEIAATMREHQSKAHDARDVLLQRFEWTRDNFFEDEANAPIYSHAQFGPRAKELHAEFTQKLGQQEQAAQNQAAAEGRHYAQKSLSWFVKEAHRRVAAFLAPDLEEAGITLAKAAAPKDGKPAKPNRQPDLSKVPTTLRDLPAADDGAAAGEFAEIDALDGEAYLTALERMTPAQRARYEAQQV